LLGILEVLSSKVDVRIYHLQPTLSFHEDIQKGRKHAKIGDDDYAFHSDSPGFPLLLSCGRYFAAQQRKLLDLGSMGYVTGESDSFVPVTLLEHLKHSVNTFDTWSAPEQVAKTDSISIHRCHGIRREVEVMRDELLRVFSTDADIKALENVRETIHKKAAEADVTGEIKGDSLDAKLSKIKAKTANAAAKAQLADMKKQMASRQAEGAAAGVKKTM
jgi:hypothetical protein